VECEDNKHVRSVMGEAYVALLLQARRCSKKLTTTRPRHVRMTTSLSQSHSQSPSRVSAAACLLLLLACINEETVHVHVRRLVGVWDVTHSALVRSSAASDLRISGSENRSNPRVDRGRLPCMAVDPLSHSVTIKRGKPGHGNQRSSCSQCPHKP
jgi:hypothetical protein